MKQLVLLRLVSSFLLMATIHGCSQQSQQVTNSPCANVNATVGIKPRADMTLLFGTDAIKAAIESVIGQLSKNVDIPVSNLTVSAREAAVSRAMANGKIPTANDVAELEKYLSNDVTSTIKQNPTCNFTVVSLGRPYVGIESVTIENMGERRIPQVTVKNTGQAEVSVHVLLRQILNNTEHSNGAIDLKLGPDQKRGLSVRDVSLPISDIESGKRVLTIVVTMSYPIEPGGTTTSKRETWQYDHTARHFILAPLQ